MNLKNKKILVTGSDGFIGSHLTENLLEEGAIVKAFVYYNSFNSWGWLDSLDKPKLDKIEIFSGDVRDPNGVRTAIKGCDIVFHLAALIGIPYSYHSPDSYIDTNVKGTLNILQAARDFELEKIIVTSTSEVYGTAKYVPIDEKHPLQGQSPYSASKIGADKIAESFYRSFGLPVAIARPFNTYGPRQSARAIIPTIITQLLKGQNKIQLGNLDPKRDLVFVQDTVQGFIEIAKSDNSVGEEINIATGVDISIRELSNLLISKINPSAELVSNEERKRPDNSEVERLQGNSEKLKRLTKWSPSISLDEGLNICIQWFSNPANLNKYKEYLYNV